LARALFATNTIHFQESNYELPYKKPTSKPHTS